MSSPTLICTELTAGGILKPVSPDSPVPVTVITALTPGSGGAGVYYNAALLATKAVVKASPATLYGWQIHNTTAAVMYVQIFNKLTAAVTVGTTVPDMAFGLAASGVLNSTLPIGIDLSIGLVVAATTTAGGLTAPATGAVVTLFYK
jgi:hypothetical protein